MKFKMENNGLYELSMAGIINYQGRTDLTINSLIIDNSVEWTPACAGGILPEICFPFHFKFSTMFYTNLGAPTFQAT
jgi:hypothetical protein